MKYNANKLFSFFAPISLLLALVGLSACVTTYQAAEGGVAGFRELQIDKYNYYVEYTEASTVSWEQIEQFAIKRCAEIAKERGFVVFDAELLDRKAVFLESSVDEIQIMSMGNTAADPPVHHTYKASAKVEGRRVTFKLTLINE